MSLHITNATASLNLSTLAKEGRLVQKAWHSRRDGREVACILGSFHPSVNSPEQCNGALMPLWMAKLTMNLFDYYPTDKVGSLGLRYAALIGKWDVLATSNWDNILTKFLIRTVDDALDAVRPVSHLTTAWKQVEDAANLVKAALESGNKADLALAKTASGAASWAARAASEAASEAASWAARAASWAARAASEAASGAARAASGAASWAARAASEAASSERLFNFLLDIIEIEINSIPTTSSKV